MNYRKDRYNGSGCLDMTAYLALRNISRNEQKHITQSGQKVQNRPAIKADKKAKGC